MKGLQWPRSDSETVSKQEQFLNRNYTTAIQSSGQRHHCESPANISLVQLLAPTDETEENEQLQIALRESLQKQNNDNVPEVLETPFNEKEASSVYSDTSSTSDNANEAAMILMDLMKGN